MDIGDVVIGLAIVASTLALMMMRLGDFYVKSKRV
mgnify:CR=1 FL=1